MTAATLPYVGPRALTDGEPLYGRTHEVEDLLDLLVANRVALLYSPSGAGKTSLIGAGLLPRLREKGFRVAPILRIDQPPAPAEEGGAPGNRFIESLLASFAVDPTFTPPPDAATLAPAEQVAALMRTHATDDLVLVLDQFETLFTLDPGDRAAKVELMTVLGELVNRRTMAPVDAPAEAPDGPQPAAPLDPRPWLLIVLREEFLAALDPYRHLVPGGLNARMRLELLDPERATLAIQGPAAAAGVTITDSAARVLVDDLRTVQETDESGTQTTLHGPTVEPVQLQVACLRLWLQLEPQEGATIDAADLPPAAGVTEALGAYYAETIATIAATTRVEEITIRDWFGESLIVQHGGRSIRAQVRDGVPPAVRAACEDAHLVRGDERSGVRWYELAHDRLVTPVIEDNARWLRDHARPLLLRARAWETSGRAASLLLRGKDLKEARKVAVAVSDLTASERDLLDASTTNERTAHRGRLLIAALGSMAIVMAGLLVALVVLRLDGERKALAGRLAVMAERQVPWVATVQRYMAEELSGGSQPLLAAACECVPELLRAGLIADRRVWSIAFDADGDGVLLGEVPGFALWRRLNDSRPVELSGLSDVGAMAWSPDHTRLAVGAGDGRLLIIPADVLREPNAGDVLAGAVEMPGTGPGVVEARPPTYTAIAWSPDGTTLAAAFGDGRLLVWRTDLATGAFGAPRAFSAPRLDHRLTGLALSADGRFLAGTESQKGQWAVWRVDDPAHPRTIDQIPSGAVAFLPGDALRLLVAGSAKGLAVVRIAERMLPVSVWGLVEDQPYLLDKEEVGVRDLAVLPQRDGTALVAVARADGKVQIVMSDGRGHVFRHGRPLPVDPDATDRVTWSPGGTRLAAVGRSGMFAVWDVPSPSSTQVTARPIVTQLVGSHDRVSVLSDGRIVWTGGGDSPFPQLPAAEGTTVDAAAIARDGSVVAIGLHGMPVQVVRVGATAPITIDGSAHRTNAIAFSRDARRLAVAGWMAVHAWDLTADPPRPLNISVPLQPPGGHIAIAWDLAGTGLFVGRCDAFGPKQNDKEESCEQGSVVWYPVDAEPDGPAREPRTAGVEGWPWVIAVDPRDPQLIAVGIRNGRVNVLRFDEGRTGKVLQSSQLVEDRAVTALAFARTGPARLAVGHPNGVLLVDPDGLGVVADGVDGLRVDKPLRDTPITALSYSDDGDLLAFGLPAWPASAGEDGVQVVDLGQGRLRRRACELAAWMTPDNERMLLLGEHRPTC